MRIRYHLLPSLFSLVMGFMGLYMWVLWNEDPPSVTVAATASDAKPGEETDLDYVITRRANNSCYVTIRPYVYDGRNVRHDYRPIKNVKSFSDEDKPDRVQAKVYIPKNAAPGSARYAPTIEYYCNAVQKLVPVEMKTPTLYFTIIGE